MNEYGPFAEDIRESVEREGRRQAAMPDAAARERARVEAQQIAAWWRGGAETAPMPNPEHVVALADALAAEQERVAELQEDRDKLFSSSMELLVRTRRLEEAATEVLRAYEGERNLSEFSWRRMIGPMAGLRVALDSAEEKTDGR